MALRSLFLAGLATSASAVKLLVSGYGPGDGTNGTITTLELTPGLADGYANATASLTKVAANTQCNTAPSWLDLSLGKGKLLCVDEGFTGKPQATIYTMALAADGSLKALNYAITPVGPVSSQFYNNNTALALAHYAGSAISTWKVTDAGFTQMQNISYANRTDIGPKPQQDHSHVHEAVIDPTGQYIIFPDLGLDAVHVFCIDPKTGLLTAHADLKSPTGYGPRHAAFWKSGSDTFLFVIHELTSRIISYKTTYVATGGLTFSKIDEVSTYGNRNAPNGSAAAEIVISPDNKFIVASNRLAPIFNVTNPDPNNSTQIGSDSIVTFKPSADGKLSFVQLAPSGGLVPRHFSLNKDGSMIAIANQNTFNMDIYARDIPTGTIGNKVASVANLPGKPSGGLTNVRWLE